MESSEDAGVKSINPDPRSRESSYGAAQAL